MQDTLLDLETLLRLPQVDSYTGFDLSPGGATLAFSWNPTGQWEIYLAPLDGSAPPRQVTTGPGSKFGPQWSPGGDRLAYALDLDGGENYDICCLDLARGVHTNFTPNTLAAIQPEFAWSPDGKQIAFAYEPEGRFEIYVLDAVKGGNLRRLPPLPHPAIAPRWSPDGRWLAVTVEARGQDHATYLVPLDGGEAWPVALQAEAQAAPLNAHDPAWSPDSRRLAFSCDLHGSFDLALYDLDTRQVTWLTSGPGDKTSPDWSPDGTRLAYVLQEGPLNTVCLLDLESGAVTGYRVAPGLHARPRFTPDGKHLVFVFDSPAHPPDLWRLSLADGGPGAGSAQQLTFSLPPHLQGSHFHLPEQVTYPGSSGQPVPALLYRPAVASLSPPPAVVYVHGGPNWLHQFTWHPLIEHMLRRGWVVLAPNYRGSTGYGRAWQLANRFDLGGADNEDVAAGAAYLAQACLADPARIAITGRSYGGYLTMTCLTAFPDRWAAGSAVVPFLNWFTGHANSRADLQHWDLENFGDPKADYDLYYQRSPFFFLDRVQAPVQLICGAHDPRCPASESIQACQALEALGKPCDLALYPDEGHSFLQTHNVVDAQMRCVRFLAGAVEGGV